MHAIMELNRFFIPQPFKQAEDLLVDSEEGGTIKLRVFFVATTELV